MQGSRDTTLLHPKLQTIIMFFMEACKAKGLPVLITETLRSVEYQDWLYASGRTRAGNIVTNARGNTYQSPHQWGVAFDFCRNVRGREYDDSDGFFRKVGAVGKSLGLVWGGDWSGWVDKPHLELPDYLPNSSTVWLRNNFKKPENFIKTWKDNDMTQGDFNKMLAAAIPVYNTISDVPEYARETISKLVGKKLLQGTGKGLGLTDDLIRMMVLNDRAGLYG